MSPIRLQMQFLNVTAAMKKFVDEMDLLARQLIRLAKESDPKK